MSTNTVTISAKKFQTLYVPANNFLARANKAHINIIHIYFKSARKCRARYKLPRQRKIMGHPQNQKGPLIEKETCAYLKRRGRARPLEVEKSRSRRFLCSPGDKNRRGVIRIRVRADKKRRFSKAERAKGRRRTADKSACAQRLGPQRPQLEVLFSLPFSLSFSSGPPSSFVYNPEGSHYTR